MWKIFAVPFVGLLLGSLCSVGAQVSQNECKPIAMQAAAHLTFRQQACFYSSKLLSPSLLLHGALTSEFEHFRNSPHIQEDGLDEFGHRFGVFYARHAAQDAGQFLAGYLNHEDPRLRVSQEHGVWRRTRAALTSVVAIRDAEGGYRPALGPIAGAFGSGLVTVGSYRSKNSLEDGFRRTGLSFGGDFGTAVFREFQPELRTFTNRVTRKK